MKLKEWTYAINGRDRNTCQTCGSVNNPDEERFHAHHIIPKSKGGKNTMDNGILLCSICHGGIHGALQVRPSQNPIYKENDNFKENNFYIVKLSLSTVKDLIACSKDNRLAYEIVDDLILNYLTNNKRHKIMDLEIGK